MTHMKTWKQDLNIGLTKAQVEESRRQNGPNTLEQEKRTSFLASFLQSFGDPIIKILLVALAINVLLFFRNFDWYEAIGICISILLATFVSTLSEYGSESAFRTLEEESARIRSRVRRAGGAEEIPIEEIVVGDLVLLQSGERIPADGILVSGSLRMDQSALNGESVEVKKSPAAGGEPTENLTPEDPYSLFRGTVVCSGNGVMRVTQVGKATLYGSLARELQSETRNSPMKLRLEQLAGTLSKIGYIAAVAVALADLTHAFLIDNGFQWAVIAAQCRDFHLVVARILHALTLAITTVVVAVPEGLPMMITIVLSANMKQMMRRHVLVRKLVGIETSGSLNVLFTDKTGTLTQGKLTVSSFVTGDGTVHTDRKSLQKGPELWRLIELACAKNNESLVSKQGIIGGNATDRALMEYALPLSPKVSGAAIQSQIPFDSRYKFSAVTLTEPASLVLVKGAPERILPACRRWYAPDGSIRPLTGTSTLKSRLSSMTGDAMRVLALAVSEKQVSAEGSFENLILIGLVGIRDNIRSDAASAVRRVQKAGIQVVMVTGDNQETAAAIARECGILHGEETEWVLTSAEMARLSDWELKERLPSLRVVARAMPSDKSRLVRAAQDLGGGYDRRRRQRRPRSQAGGRGFCHGKRDGGCKKRGRHCHLKQQLLLYLRSRALRPHHFQKHPKVHHLPADHESVRRERVGSGPYDRHRHADHRGTDALDQHYYGHTGRSCLRWGTPAEGVHGGTTQAAGRADHQLLYEIPDRRHGDIYRRAVHCLFEAALLYQRLSGPGQSGLFHDSFFLRLYLCRNPEQLQRPHLPPEYFGKFKGQPTFFHHYAGRLSGAAFDDLFRRLGFSDSESPVDGPLQNPADCLDGASGRFHPQALLEKARKIQRGVTRPPSVTSGIAHEISDIARLFQQQAGTEWLKSAFPLQFNKLRE